MHPDRLSIDELADAAGLTRRGIRFYVQQRLLPAPHGVGRGKHYGHTHVEQLGRVRELQSAGHSLDEIRHILAGHAPAAPARSRPAMTIRPALRSELWRKLLVMDGVELSFDAGRFDPGVETLAELKDVIAAAFRAGRDQQPPTGPARPSDEDQA